jgi:hypothetical protein
MRLLRAALILACFDSSALPSIFVAAICKDGVVVVADSRLTFTDNQTGQPVAYADGLNKIIRFDSAVMAETGQGFLTDQRFDEFVKQFADSAGSLAADAILPALLQYGSRKLAPDDLEILKRQHMAVAKFRKGAPLLCGYDGKYRPCVGKDYIQSSPTDFDKLRAKLPAMAALAVADEARASMQRYISATGKNATMGGEFSAVLLTASGIRDLWTLENPLTARSLDELVTQVAARKIRVTLIPPATTADLERLLQ